MLDELTAVLAAYEARIDNTISARLGHVEASALLTTLKGEIREMVRRLDGWNRFRFRNEPTLLVAWKSAMKVVTVVRAAQVPTVPVTPVGAAVDVTSDPKAA